MKKILMILFAIFSTTSFGLYANNIYDQKKNFSETKANYDILESNDLKDCIVYFSRVKASYIKRISIAKIDVGKTDFSDNILNYNYCLESKCLVELDIDSMSCNESVKYQKSDHYNKFDSLNLNNKNINFKENGNLLINRIGGTNYLSIDLSDLYTPE